MSDRTIHVQALCKTFHDEGRVFGFDELHARIPQALLRRRFQPHLNLAVGAKGGSFQVGVRVKGEREIEMTQSLM